VRSLLQELERLAAGKFSFPQMATLIHRDGGERLNAANITRWRNGTEFPTEDAVRRWTRLCDGDLETVMRQYVPAQDAYNAWKADGRPPTTAPPDIPAVSGTAAADARPLRMPARWVVALAAVVLAAATVTVILRWPQEARGIVVGSCAWPARAVPTPSRVTPAGGLLYKLPSGDGSRNIPILAGGSVLQPFVASASRIGTVASIIGLDGDRTDVSQPHPVRFEIILPHSTRPARVIAQQDTAVTPDNVNKDVAVAFASPVAVEAGKVYVLRAVNLSTSVVGFYVNARTGPDRSVPYPEDVCLENAEGPFTNAGWSMSGFVAAAA
jgi:hypothetical protein